MAFVKITDGNVRTNVSMGAFNNYFKKLGFWLDKDNEPETKAPVVAVDDIPDVEEEEVVENTTEEVEDNNSDNDFIVEILEKPVSQWSTEEMKRFVTINNIDTSSAKKASEVRNIIKEYLSEQEKNK